jgi:predicted O-methyltransferase YrrM
LLASLRGVGRRLFYRSEIFRTTLLVVLWPWLRKRLPRLGHLAFYDEDAIGPVQREEALVLHALVRLLRPRVVVEIGFEGGLSAFNFLLALEPDAKLYTFDISDLSESTARTAFRHVPNFRFQRKSQDEITAADVDFQPVDLAFLDASHDFDVNIRTFERLETLLADDALVVVHDTGTWRRELFGGAQAEAARGWDQNWVRSDEYAHRPGERAFINWIRDVHPQFAQVNLHSRRALRNGMTVLQRSRPLSLPAGHDWHDTADRAVVGGSDEE